MADRDSGGNKSLRWHTMLKTCFSNYFYRENTLPRWCPIFCRRSSIALWQCNFELQVFMVHTNLWIMKHNVCSDFEIKQKNLGDLSKGSARVEKKPLGSDFVMMIEHIGLLDWSDADYSKTGQLAICKPHNDQFWQYSSNNSTSKNIVKNLINEG